MNYFAKKHSCEVSLSAFNGNTVIRILTIGNVIYGNSLLFLPGSRQHAHSTAPGKLFLSRLSAEELNAWLMDRCLLPHTSKTIIDRDALCQEIERIRNQGYSTAEGEMLENYATLSFPVLNRAGDVLCSMDFSVSLENFPRINSDEFKREVKSVLRNLPL